MALGRGRLWLRLRFQLLWAGAAVLLAQPAGRAVAAGATGCAPGCTTLGVCNAELGRCVYNLVLRRLGLMHSLPRLVLCKLC